LIHYRISGNLINMLIRDLIILDGVEKLKKIDRTKGKSLVKYKLQNSFSLNNIKAFINGEEPEKVWLFKAIHIPMLF